MTDTATLKRIAIQAGVDGALENTNLIIEKFDKKFENIDRPAKQTIRQFLCSHRIISDIECTNNGFSPTLNDEGDALSYYAVALISFLGGVLGATYVFSV